MTPGLYLSLSFCYDFLRLAPLWNRFETHKIIQCSDVAHTHTHTLVLIIIIILEQHHTRRRALMRNNKLQINFELCGYIAYYMVHALFLNISCNLCILWWWWWGERLQSAAVALPYRVSVCNLQNLKNCNKNIEARLCICARLAHSALELECQKEV